MFICNDVAVQFTESYSDGIEIPIEVGLESDDPICISAKNRLFSSEGRWSHIFLAHTFLNILDTT